MKLQRIIRKKDLSQFVGLKRTQIDDLIKKKEFPQGVPLTESGRAVGWFEDVLVDWQQQRRAALASKKEGGK